MCEHEGVPVEKITVAAHAREETWPLGDDPFFMCERSGCPVIYFTAGYSKVLQRPDVKSRVTFKEKEAPRPLCYCKQVTEEDVREAIEKGARTFEEVRAVTGIGGGGQCRITNPSGRCCSHNYKPFIERTLRQARNR
jgi:bacterioferritin-associated ferredoxin